MLKVFKCVLHLSSVNVQSTRQGSTKRILPRPNRIKKLMKEYKSVFGVLVETKVEKKKRLKLERKGKIPQQRPNEIDTELQWVTNNCGGNLKKIIVLTEPQSQHTSESVCESTLDSHRTNGIDANSLSDQSHIGKPTNPDKNRKPKGLSKNFNKVILKIKPPADQNIESAASDQTNQETKLETTNSTCDLSTATKDVNNNHNEENVAVINSHFYDNKTPIDSDASGIQNTVVKYNFLSNSERLSDIIIKNLLSFPIVGAKQDSTDPTEIILSISGKDDLETIRFPSVTRILTQTMPLESKVALEAWKQKMIEKLGQEGFDLHQKALLEDGSSLHSCIARCLLGKEYEVPPRIESVFESVQRVLGDVSHVKAIETHVAHTKLRYKGVIDCIASYRGENYVIDWKKSDRKKLDLKETYDAPVQLAAYIGAINASNLYPFVINRGLLVIAYTSGDPATVHEVRDNTLQRYWTAWLRRLQKYYVETANSDDNKNTRQ